MTGLTLKEAEYQGYRAQNCGRDRLDNPYDAGSEMSEMWLAGWEAGKLPEQTTLPVKRYVLDQGHSILDSGGASMSLDPLGDYVEFEDYEALRDSHKALMGIVTEFHGIAAGEYTYKFIRGDGYMEAVSDDLKDRTKAALANAKRLTGEATIAELTKDRELIRPNCGYLVCVTLDRATGKES